MRQSLFDDEPVTVDDLKLQCKKIYLNYEDIVFSPLPQLLCQNCGMFGRTYRCPPFTMPYYKTREHLKKYNKFLLIVSESDKEEILKRFKHEKEHYKLGDWKSWFYAGTQANAINIGKVRADVRRVFRFLNTRYDNILCYDVGGGCLRCRPCNKQLHKPCKHPRDSFPSPEGSGIDLYQTLRQKGFEIETPPITKYISVAMICWKEEKHTES